MDFDKTGLFGAIKKRMAWLGQRQEVLAQNIANADTPKFRPKDIEPFKFDELLRRDHLQQVNMARTNEKHLEGNSKRVTDFREQTTHRPWETSPAGNAVVLEEQMAKVNETQIAHKLTSQLYKKHLAMMRMAIGK